MGGLFGGGGDNGAAKRAEEAAALAKKEREEAAKSLKNEQDIAARNKAKDLALLSDDRLKAASGQRGGFALLGPAGSPAGFRTTTGVG